MSQGKSEGYDIFMSYSHAADRDLATHLQSKLERFERGFFRARRYRVFRDETDLTANPGLYDSLVARLDQSNFLLVCASPEAAESDWVDREISHWLTRPAALNSFGLVWTRGTGNDEHDGPPIPPSLAAAVADRAELFAVDLRSFRSTKDIRQEDVARIVAHVTRRNYREVFDRERKRQRVRNFTVLAAGVVVCVALAIAAITTSTAIRLADSVDTESRNVEARDLSAQAEEQLQSNPAVSLATAIEALSVSDRPTAAAYRALVSARQGLEVDDTRRLRDRGVSALTWMGGATNHYVELDSDGMLRSIDLGDSSTRTEVDFVSDPIMRAEQVERVIGNASNNRAVFISGNTISAWSLSGEPGPIGHLTERDMMTAAVVDRVGSRNFHIGDVAISPNGATIAIGFSDGVLLWTPMGNDAVSPLHIGPNLRFLQTPAGSPGFDGHVSINDDGSRVALAAEVLGASGGVGEQSAWVWDTATGEVLRTLPEPRNETGGLAVVSLSPSGEYAATTGSDEIVRIWSLDGVTPPIELVGHTGWPSDIAFSADGEQVLTGSSDRKLIVWSAASGEELARLEHDSEGANSLGFSIVGDLAFARLGNTLATWQLDASSASGLGQPAATVNRAARGPVSFDSDGDTLGFLSEEGVVVYVDLEGNILGGSKGGPGQGFVSFASDFDDVGNYWTVVSNGVGDEQIVGFSSPEGEVIGKVELEWVPQAGRMSSADIDPNRSLAAKSGGSVTLHRLSAGSPYSVEGFGARQDNLVFSEDGSQLYVVDNDGRLAIFDPATGATQQAGTPVVDHGGSSADVDRANSILVIVGVSGGGTIVDLTTLSKLAEFDPPGASFDVAVDGTGNYVATVGDYNDVMLWHARSGDLIVTLPGHSAPVRSVDFSEDNRHLVTASDDGSVKVWENPLGLASACAAVVDFIDSARLGELLLCDEG